HNVSQLTLPVPGVYLPAVFLADAGWIGVQLFFVLSGFLITGNLLDTSSSPNYYRSFFARRVLPLFPPYYAPPLVSLVLVPLLFTLSAAYAQSLHHQLWIWTFLLNWTQPYGLSVQGFSHFWSLAVEEQFYFIWPLLIHRRTPRQVVILCAVVGLAAVAI